MRDFNCRQKKDAQIFLTNQLEPLGTLVRGEASSPDGCPSVRDQLSFAVLNGNTNCICVARLNVYCCERNCSNDNVKQISDAMLYNKSDRMKNVFLLYTDRVNYIGCGTRVPAVT